MRGGLSGPSLQSEAVAGNGTLCLRRLPEQIVLQAGHEPLRMPSAEHRVRQADGSWVFREFSGADALVKLKSIGCRLALRPVYERFEF